MAATATPANAYADAMKQVGENYMKTMQAGMKFFEDTAHIYTEMSTKNVDDAKVRFEKFAAELAELNKHNLDRFQSFFEEQTRRNASLTPYMVDPAAFSNPAELYDRMSAMWRNSFESLREAVTTSAKATSEAIEGWSHTFRTGK